MCASAFQLLCSYKLYHKGRPTHAPRHVTCCTLKISCMWLRTAHRRAGQTIVAAHSIIAQKEGCTAIQDVFRHICTGYAGYRTQQAAASQKGCTQKMMCSEMTQAGIMLATQLQNKPSKTLKLAQTHPRHSQDALLRPLTPSSIGPAAP